MEAGENQLIPSIVKVQLQSARALRISFAGKERQIAFTCQALCTAFS
jgi:hypothetical protein